MAAGVLVAINGHGDRCCGADARAKVAVAPLASATDTIATLAPSESVDPAFEGCKAACGSRSATALAAARVQPGAKVGDTAFCPVSGAVFHVSDASVKREVVGKTLWFCCASCAAYFDAHRAELLAVRGIAGGGA